MEISCDFEEVYVNGELQQGILLVKNDKLRYQYFNKDLYTLLYVNQKIFLVNNLDTKKVQYLENQNNILPSILEIFDEYPNFKKKYMKNGYEIKIEKGDGKFIKRLVIKSNKLNLSIFFINCREVSLRDKYFNFNPFYQYVSN